MGCESFGWSKIYDIMICKSCTICLISLYLIGKISSNESCCTFELVLGMADWAWRDDMYL